MIGARRVDPGSRSIATVSDMRRGTPEPPPRRPTVSHEPGSGRELLEELAPLLAEEGIDIHDPATIPDRRAFEAAMSRAIQRRNMELFTPVGAARDSVVTVLRGAVSDLLAGETVRAGRTLRQVPPEATRAAEATVAGCIGVALDLLDRWLSGVEPDAPAGLAAATRLLPGNWVGERTATDLLALARKDRAYRSLDRVIARYGGEAVLFGAALALASAVGTWAHTTGAPVAEVVAAAIRAD